MAGDRGQSHFFDLSLWVFRGSWFETLISERIVVTPLSSTSLLFLPSPPMNRKNLPSNFLRWDYLIKTNGHLPLIHVIRCYVFYLLKTPKTTIPSDHRPRVWWAKNMIHRISADDHPHAFFSVEILVPSQPVHGTVIRSCNIGLLHFRANFFSVINFSFTIPLPNPVKDSNDRWRRETVFLEFIQRTESK